MLPHADKGKPSGKGQLRFANGDALDGVQWNGDLVLKALYTRAAKVRPLSTRSFNVARASSGG